MSGTMVDAGDTKMNKTDTALALKKLEIHETFMGKNTSLDQQRVVREGSLEDMI